MNERIRELMKQSMVEYQFDMRFSPEKFAELIVQDLISGVVNRHPEYFVSQALKWQMGCRIKEHFGVEEPKGWVCPKCGVDRTKVSCPQGHTAAVEGKCPMIGVAQ